MLMTTVTRVKPLQTTIASGSGIEDSPCLSMSRRVKRASDHGCSVDTRVTQVTRVAQSKSAIGVSRMNVVLFIQVKDYQNGAAKVISLTTWFNYII